MSGNTLPSWTARPAADTAPPAAQASPSGPTPTSPGSPAPKPGSGATSNNPGSPSPWLTFALGAAIATGFIGIFVLTSGSDDRPVVAPETTTTVIEQTTTVLDESSSATGVVPDELALTEETIPAEDSTRDPSADTATPTADRRAIFRQGVVYLEGRVPAQEIADEIVQKAGLVVGPDNVVDNYTIDPTVAFDPNEGAPLYVEDLVLFPTGSAEIAPQFAPLLDLGILLMTQNPSVTIDVIGHTDSVGSRSRNLELSKARVDAVVAYWVAAGIDPARVNAIPKGEAEPIADNATDEGKQINRRVEFIIAGLLG